MSTIIEFNQKEKNKFIKSIEKKEYWLNGGDEGSCYLINGDVYKIFRGICNHNYIISNTLCKDDINLESFIFPTEIYTCNQIVFGCKTDTYIPENKIYERRLYSGKFPSIDNIKKALPQLIKDIYFLSEKHVFADDLAWRNLMFDGKKLYVIDTLDYEIHNEVDVEKIYKENINLLIYECFNPFITEYEYRYKEYSTLPYKPYEVKEERLKKLYNLIPYIKKVAKQIQLEHEEKEIQKIKK